MTTTIQHACHPVDAASVIALLQARPRLLALGEPTHGEDGLLRLRNELFRQLIEQHGYQTITIESDCLAALEVDDYVTWGVGTLDEVMRSGFSHGFGASDANRELIGWMRSYNDGRPAGERVRFAGFDGPLEVTGGASPRRAITALHGYLTARVDHDALPCTGETLDRLLGSDDRWSDPAAMMDPSKSIGRSPQAGRLKVIADDLAALLDEQAPHLLATSTRDDWDRAHLCSRTAIRLLRYHFWMADTSPARLEHLLAMRETMMAANLLATAEKGRALVHANNGHLQREISSMRMGEAKLQWLSAGAIVGAYLGDQYAFIATALGTIRHRGVGTPPPGTIEAALHDLVDEHGLFHPRRLAAGLGDHVPTARVSPWPAYGPLDPAQLAGLDGLVYVKDVPAGKTWWPA